jgi:membrane protease YdiL (CAAX protease family)
LARELGWSTRNLGPNAAYGVLGYALATPLMFLVALLAPSLFRHAPAPSNPVIPEMAATSGFWTTALLILLASVAAPLVEELLFRGVFYNAAKLRLGPWPAIVLTGLVFGFLHPVGIVEMLAISVLGGVFAWMAETRKSLVPSITAHCLNNLISTLILLLALAG